MTFPEAKAQLQWTASQAEAALRGAGRRARRLRRAVPIIGRAVGFAYLAAHAFGIRARMARQHRDVVDRFQATNRRRGIDSGSAAR
jgi:type VI protein secretion system component VasF